jgi:hypothetical protein
MKSETTTAEHQQLEAIRHDARQRLAKLEATRLVLLPAAYNDLDVRDELAQVDSQIRSCRQALQ